MKLNIKNLIFKFINFKKYNEKNLIYRREKEKKIIDSQYNDIFFNIEKSLNSKKEISFLHSGHIGDIINCLPVIKKISENHRCKLLIKLDHPTGTHYPDHPSGQYLIRKEQYNLLLPLLKKQNFLEIIKIYEGENIDINFDIIRDLPINLLFDNLRYAFISSGVQVNLNEPFIEVEEHPFIKNRIVILRSLRYQNYFISYKFLENFPNPIFIGIKKEFNELKKELKNLEFYECKDFLEMAMIIKSCKLFIGNSSLGIDLAESLKVPRLLEACPYFPARQIHGENGYDFYFQPHFEKYFKVLFKG